jgi:hypothetical protein
MNMNDSTTRCRDRTHSDSVSVSAPPLPKREVLALFIGSRLAIVLIAGLSLQIVGKGKYFNAPASVIDWFMCWDAGWYHDIAMHGCRPARCPWLGLQRTAR